MPRTDATYRIGEVAERTGLGPSRLRQWERRYGFPDPDRTRGGHRLYSQETVRDLRRVKAWIDDGMMASQAVERLRERRRAGEPRDEPAPVVDDLVEALVGADLAAADRLLSRAHGRHPLSTVLADVVAPALHRVGEAWHDGEITVAQEHVASDHLRDHVRSLLSSADRSGRPVVAATPPGERHEVGALAAAAVLDDAGVPVRFLGPDCPVPDLAAFADGVDARAVVLSACYPEPLDDLPDDAFEDVDAPVLMGGSAVDAAEARRLGADPLDDLETLPSAVLAGEASATA